jgi:hypothetical protein
MYTQSDAFGHDWHSSPSGANLACTECHALGAEKRSDSAKSCGACHTDLYDGVALASAGAASQQTYLARSYVDAMHVQCIECHRRIAVDEQAKQFLIECSTCHGGAPTDYLTADIREERPVGGPKPVVLPDLDLGSAEIVEN